MSTLYALLMKVAILSTQEVTTTSVRYINFRFESYSLARVDIFQVANNEFKGVEK